MKLALVTAGAAGMYCGSCMHDNTLAAALIARGHDALLIPTYTPIRTDEVDVSQGKIFFGGINVYLREKSALFRHSPWLFDRLLNSPRLLRWVSRFAMKTDAAMLGELTVSMLEGDTGRQKKGVVQLCRYLRDEAKPDLVSLTNVLLSGVVPHLKKHVGRPVVATLQGDDIFTESLPEPYKSRSLELIRRHCREIDGFVATSGSYADFMAGYLDVPRSKIDVVYPGLNLRGHGGPRDYRSEPPYTVGYFARVCPEKGFHNLVDGYIALRRLPGVPPTRLRVSGWLGEHNRPFFDEQVRKLSAADLAGEFEHVESPDHAGKVRFLQGIDVLSVPTSYREPKGLYVLEALANGTPVVQPRHGSFPELVEATGGGLLVNPDDPADLARGLRELLANAGLRQEAGRKGREAVASRFTAAEMARRTEDVFNRYV